MGRHPWAESELAATLQVVETTGGSILKLTGQRSPGFTSNSKTPFGQVGSTEPKELTVKCRETREESKGETKL